MRLRLVTGASMKALQFVIRHEEIRQKNSDDKVVKGLQ